MPLAEPDSAICGGCSATPGSAGSIDRCVAALSYEFPVDRLVTGLKYRHRLECARVLGELLSIRLLEETSEPGFRLPDLIVPVPLHTTRLLARGFNQAAAIGRWVAQTLCIPIDFRHVRRVRNTPGQTGLSRLARLQNMHGAFSLAAPAAGARVALLDDVITTTATVAALADLMKDGGAAEVQVWAPARTIK